MLRNIGAEVSGLEYKEVSLFTEVLENVGYDFSEMREKIEGLPAYKEFYKKYESDALDNHFPHNYVPGADEIEVAKIEIRSQVDESKYGILREFLVGHCKEIRVTFRV